MQDSVFHTADVLIHIHPVICFLFGKSSLVVQRIGITQIIPAGAHKGIHGVGFTTGRFTADRTSSVYKLIHIF